MNQICQLNKDRGDFDVNERSAAFHSDRISEDIFFCWYFINKEIENSMGLPKTNKCTSLSGLYGKQFKTALVFKFSICVRQVIRSNYIVLYFTVKNKLFSKHVNSVSVSFD